MRSLEETQKDLQFLSTDKENFFSKLFRFNENRIKDLRKEEFEAINLSLLEKDAEYKKTACENLKILSSLEWKFKVIDTDSQQRYPNYKDELAGEIASNGIAFCERCYRTLALDKKTPTNAGTIDHFGRIRILTPFIHDNFLSEPKTLVFQLFETGKLLYLGKESDHTFRRVRMVDRIAVSPFKHHLAEFSKFLDNKKFLRHCIQKQTLTI